MSSCLDCVTAHVTLVGGSDDHKRLVADLFKNYTKVLRPVRKFSTSIDLEMMLLLSQVIHLDERMQTLKVNVWMTFNWKDEFMMWDPTEYGNITDLKIASELVWMPDVVLYNNAANEYKDFMRDEIVVITNEGHVNWAAPKIISSYCSINVKTFPFDEQQCLMKFGPWQHEGKELRIWGGGSGDASVYNSDGQWDILDMTAKSDEVEYPDAPGKTYTDVTYTIRFKRRPLYYVFNLILPCTFVSMVALLSFFLPPESGEKISLGITVLLSLTVFLLLVAETMPPTSAVPVVGQYFMSTMVLISGSLAMSVMVLNMHHCRPDCRPVPHWVRIVVIDCLGRILAPSVVKNSKTDRRRLSVRTESLQKHCHNWELEDLMTCADPLSPNTKRELNGVSMNQSAHAVPGKDGTVHVVECGRRSDSFTRDAIPILRSMLTELRKLTANNRSEREEKLRQNEWQRVALVMDRVFLLVFLIGTFAASSFMFSKA
ncbi:neuronal acetylcholine receptor subunit alpha-10-like isoform X1 [Lytechinus variegatus]|uniref:neuronal acetylcholine receptor subunit alpha-10-like isoform X1 n=1 Tax=Lytechinus variegatus TaxID=7654 RepID=UPI001BB1DB3B|nr:neuronal acetylcholine receptor subunit alpha-10-like isoform X1 [Lytechinus variegatus]XP_041477599.1 neuronal acetylcholine receptor subunit alpha-10-like isoform X1 [Lytechinus variegatus]